jgi:hypothetical protein
VVQEPVRRIVFLEHEPKQLCVVAVGDEHLAPLAHGPELGQRPAFVVYPKLDALRVEPVCEPRLWPPTEGAGLIAVRRREHRILVSSTPFDAREGYFRKPCADHSGQCGSRLWILARRLTTFFVPIRWSSAFESFAGEVGPTALCCLFNREPVWSESGAPNSVATSAGWSDRSAPPGF